MKKIFGDRTNAYFIRTTSVNLAPHILSNAVSPFRHHAGVKNKKTHVSKCCGAKINPVCRVSRSCAVFQPRSPHNTRKLGTKCKRRKILKIMYKKRNHTQHQNKTLTTNPQLVTGYSTSRKHHAELVGRHVATSILSWLQ